MYKLQSGDKQIPSGFVNSNIVREARNNLTEDIIYYVMEKTYTVAPKDNEVANKVAAYLIIADEWPNRINEKDANIIFFALCNNINPERTVKITNFSQNRTLYEAVETGDYRDLVLTDGSDDPQYDIGNLENVKCMYDGTKIKFKVPVYEYKLAKISKRMKAINTKMGYPSLICDDGSEIKIPWKIFGGIVLKRKDGRNFMQCAAENNIVKKAISPECQKELIEVLNFCGFRIDNKIDVQVDIFKEGKARVFFDNNKFMMVGETPENPDWIRGVFRPTRNYYVILFKGNWYIYQG